MTVLPQLPLYTTRWQYSVVYKLCDQLYTLKRRISLMVINPYSWTLRQHSLPKPCLLGLAGFASSTLFVDIPQL